MHSSSLRHWGPLLVIAASLCLFQSAYVVLGLVPSAAASILLGNALLLFVVLWIPVDARRRRCVPCFDFGFFVVLAYPLSVVWYLLWSRRLRGLLTLGVLLLLYLAPWLCALATWITLTVLAGSQVSPCALNQPITSESTFRVTAIGDGGTRSVARAKNDSGKGGISEVSIVLSSRASTLSQLVSEGLFVAEAFMFQGLS